MKRRVYGVLGLAGLLVLSTAASIPVQASPPALVDGAPGDAHVVSAGAAWNVWSPAPGHIANYPQAFTTDNVVDGFTRKKVFAFWQNTPDNESYATTGARAFSTDGGETYPSMSDGAGTVTSGIRLDDGSLLTVDFLADGTQQTGYQLNIARSTDLGATWTRGKAPLDAGTYQLGWIRVHRGIVQLADGTLLLPIYGVDVRDGSQSSSFLLESTDRGAHWKIRSRISDAERPGTNEAFVTPTSDGRLVAFLRNVNEVDLMQAYSSDQGRTWTRPAVIVPPKGAPTGLADPAAVLQPNGMLVLAYGRPDNTVLVSRDGTGRTWDDYENVFGNTPRTTWPGSTHGSSGNPALANVASNQSLVFGDTCGHQWMCREKGQHYRIWVRRIDAVTPGTGKLDLAGKVHAGTVRLNGDVVSSAAFPETRLAGAVDGSSERYAAARFAPDGSHSLVVELDQAYRLDRIGLMLGYGTPQDADVQLSADGRSWGQPVLKLRQSVDYALRYHSIEPATARFVKISGPRALEAVTELELYSADTLTFENDAVDSAPRGFTGTRYAYVNDTIMQGAGDSRRRLSLVDADGDSFATATLPRPAVAAQRLDYAYAATQYASGMRILVRGKDASGHDIDPWQFRLVPSGTGLKLSAFDGSTWQDVGTTKTRPANQVWTTVRVDTTADQATVTIGGETLPATTWRAVAAVAFTGATFDTDIPNTPVQSGMQHDFDDIRVTAIP
ncbi:exo-alpha-sialidase [Flindersiella endophytica]